MISSFSLFYPIQKDARKKILISVKTFYSSLYSVKAVCHKDFSIGEEIELRLMRRERDSLLPMPAASFSQEVLHEMQRIGSPNAATPFAKLIIASKEEVND